MELKQADPSTPGGQLPPAGYSQPAYGGAPSWTVGYDSPFAGDEGAMGSLDPLRLLLVLRKRWIWALLVLVLMVGMAVFYLTRTSPVYRATALMELSVRRPRILTQQAAVIDDQSTSQSEEIFNTRLEKFKGRRCSTMWSAACAHPGRRMWPPIRILKKCWPGMQGFRCCGGRA
jgi:hypothetical protein